MGEDVGGKGIAPITLGNNDLLTSPPNPSDVG